MSKMKIDLQELKKAIAFIEKHGRLTEVTLEIDINNRMLITYSEPMGGDLVTIRLYDSDTEKMADVTTTTRL
jgi:tricorn protease-like protein